MYGEIYGPTQSGYPYGSGELRLAVFDIWDQDGLRWLDYEEMRSACIAAFCATAPLLYLGPYDRKLMEELAEGLTWAGDTGGSAQIREGIVIEAVGRRDNERIKMKLVSRAYLEKEGAS